MFLLALLGVLLALVPAPASCPAVVIDVGGEHQAMVTAMWYWMDPTVPLTGMVVNGGDDLTRALDAAVGCGAKVVNISIGVDCDCESIRAAVARTSAADTLIVAAAGNNGPTYPTRFPAAYPGVLSVGASDGPSNKAMVYAPATFSSFAAPQAAATAYRLRELHPGLTAISTTFLITSTAKSGVLDPLAALGAAGYRTYYVPGVWN